MVSREEAFVILKRWEKDHTPLTYMESGSQGSMTSIGEAISPVRVRVSPEGIMLISDVAPRERPLRLPSECKFKIKPEPPSDGNSLEVEFSDGCVVFLAEHSEV
jgi:hypothetical protein